MVHVEPSWRLSRTRIPGSPAPHTPLATSLDVYVVLSLRRKCEFRSVCGAAVYEMTTEQCLSSTLAVSRRHSAASRACTAAVNSIRAGTMYYERLMAPQNDCSWKL